MKIISAIFLATLLATCATASNAQPDYYKVKDSLTEHLNVREAPSSESKDVGDLAPGAQPFEILETDASGEWGRILWLEKTAWVALRFMQPIELPHLENTIVPIGLLCAGAEPFWTMEIESAENAVLSTSDSVTPMSLSNVSVSKNRAKDPVAIELLSSSTTAITVVSRNACSDGMSDINYSWAAEIIMQPELKLLSGCCVMR